MQDPWTKLACRVIAPEEAGNAGHSHVLGVLARAFDEPGVTLLCEPSIVGARTGPPDIAVVDPASGVHVVEVKAARLRQITSIQAGGAIEIEYESGRTRKDPFEQAAKAMFAVKNAATRHFRGEMNICFESWVAFPAIRRAEWEEKFGPAVPQKPEALFRDDLEAPHLAKRMRDMGRWRVRQFGNEHCPPKQIESVMAAFGDSAVLAPPQRPHYTAPPGSKGARLNEAVAEYRALTEQQQRLVSSEWKDGPRLVRGVAGSGKTVVLATQVARTAHSLQREALNNLFEPGGPVPPVLVVCFNRTLVPFMRDRIEKAYLQRTGEALPELAVSVMHINGLMYYLSTRKLCSYIRFNDMRDAGERARRYLEDMDKLSGAFRQRLDEGLFHAAFVDEGQDCHENEYRILMRLVKRGPEGQPRLFVFYDDAQNLYARARPTWSELGLDIRGRSVVMDESFRNTRQILEPAFNVLLGSHADDPTQVKTRGFADTATLKEKGLIEWRQQHIHVKFANREGDAVEVERHESSSAEAAAVAELCERWMLSDGMLPQDIMVLAKSKDRARVLARTIGSRIGDEKVRLVISEDQKDQLVVREGAIAVSTTASAKGYDAPAVILAGAEEFEDEVSGRASMYVGCTRAREWLVFSSAGESPLVTEMARAVEASKR